MADNSNDETTVGCFYFRSRARSFDLHQTAPVLRHAKAAILSRLLRSGSENIVRHSNNSCQYNTSTGNGNHHPDSMISGSNCIPTRRSSLMTRLPPTEEYLSEKHHLYNTVVTSRAISPEIEKLSPWTSLMSSRRNRRRALLQRGHMGSFDTDFPLAPPPSPAHHCKHASFRDEVEVIEYDRKEINSLGQGAAPSRHTERLRTADSTE